MEDKRFFTRFILRVICNRCGIQASCSITWLPNERFQLTCHNCQDAEMMYVGPIYKQEDNKQKLVIEKEFSQEEEFIKKIIAERIKEKQIH